MKTEKTSKKNQNDSSATNHVSETIAANPQPLPSPSSSVATVLAVAMGGASITPPGDLPPQVGAPATPKGWKAKPRKKKGGAKGQRPRGAQVTNALAAAQELAKSATYVEDFGTRAPAAANVSFVVANAAKWRETWEGARQFAAYAAEQRAAWEQEAMGQMDTLEPAFAYVTMRDPTVAEKYSATAKFFTAPKETAKRAVVTKKEKSRKEKKQQQDAGSAAAAAPAAGTGTAKA